MGEGGSWETGGGTVDSMQNKLKKVNKVKRCFKFHVPFSFLLHIFVPHYLDFAGDFCHLCMRVSILHVKQ